MPDSRRQGYLQALAAVALFSTSPVLIRWAGGVSAVEITFWRLLLAAGAVGVLAAAVRRPVQGRVIAAPRFAAFGVVIALHFFFYIASLFFTSVAHALALVYTAPLFIAVLSHFWLKERLTPRKWVGVALGVVGAAVLAGFEPALSARTLAGDALALGSAIAFAVYSVIGRSQRAAIRLFDYATGVYVWGALWLLPLAATQLPASRYDTPTALALLGLGIGPLGIGHTLYNAALRRIPATEANLIATLEVAGGVALSWVLLGEAASPAALAGAAIVLVGIVLVVT
jgi:drug/metabolite transporter (DMT)-like permease